MVAVLAKSPVSLAGLAFTLDKSYQEMNGLGEDWNRIMCSLILERLSGIRGKVNITYNFAKTWSEVGHLEPRV